MELNADNAKCEAGEQVASSETAPAIPDGKTMLMLIGFGCYFAVQSCTSFSPGLLLMAAFTPDQSAFLRAVTMLAQVATLMAVFFNAGRIEAAPLKLLTGGSSLCAASIACSVLFSFVDPVLPVAAVAWALLGVGLSTLALFWCLVLSSAQLRSGVMLFVKAAILNIALFLVVALVSPSLVSVASYAALIGASIVSARVLYRWVLSNKVDPPPQAVRRDRTIINPWVDPFAICNGFVVGLFVIVICSQGLFSTTIVMASGILGILSSLALYRVFPKSAYNVRYLHQSTLPFLVLAVLLVPFFGDEGFLAGACITIVVRSYTQVSGWNEATTTIREFRFDPLKLFSRRDIPMWTGFALGTIAGYVLFVANTMEGIPLFAFVAGLAVCLVSSYALYGLREMMIVDRMDSIIVENMRDQGSISALLEKPFASKCERIIEAYGLSPREAEVFRLLAKGRNAEYIQNELFISVSTARTHIYHIYKKIGISSRQSLIDIVEDASFAPGTEDVNPTSP